MKEIFCDFCAFFENILRLEMVTTSFEGHKPKFMFLIPCTCALLP